VIVPHDPGPAQLSVQSSPRLPTSVAVPMMLAVPAVATESVVGTILTAIGAIATVALFDFVRSATEVAVIVTVPPAGIVEGAV